MKKPHVEFYVTREENVEQEMVCPSCNEPQVFDYIDYFESKELEGSLYVCTGCQAKLFSLTLPAQMLYPDQLLKVVSSQK